MNLKKGTEIQVEILHLNISGRGVAETVINDEPYFVAVDGLFPGDVAKVTIVKIKKKYLEAKLVELISPSPHRTKPKSDHSEVCGGSPWEVLDYDYQLEIKQKEVKRILDNINLKDVQVNPIIPTDEPWFYRNKMQYSFGFNEKMEPVLGLHVAGRRFDIFDVRDCHLAEPWFNQVLEFARQNLLLNGFTPYSYNTNSGQLRNLTLRVGKNTGQAMLILTVSQEVELSEVQDFFKLAAITFPNILSFYFETVTVQKGTPTTAKFELVSGQENIAEELTVNNKTYQYFVGPETFFQPNTNTAAKIYEEVTRLAEIDKQTTVYDLFSGTGTIGISLAEQAKAVYGIDIVPESIALANQNLVKNSVGNATYLAADIYKLPADLDWEKPDLVVIDPPRAGLTPKVVEYLVEMNPAKIVYVSCNLKSFCQDVLEFQMHGKKLVSLTPIDQFPHTKHLEVVGLII